MQTPVDPPVPDSAAIDDAATEDTEEKSKSQIKREKTALFEMGEVLCALPNKQLTAISLSENVREIVARIRRMPMRDARRRELRYLAKQFEEQDVVEVQSALSAIERGSRQQALDFHKLEQLRDLLVENHTEGISAIVAEFPQADRQLLNQLARNSRKESQHEKPPVSARKAFKYLQGLQKASE